LCAALIAVAAPQTANLPPDIVALLVLSCLWRIAELKGRARLPSKPLLVLLTLLCAALVFLHFHKFHGPEAAASLLFAGLALKLLEMKTVRELYLIIYLSFLAMVTVYLFDQGVAMAIYSLGVIALLMTALLSLNGGAALSWRARLGTSAALIAQAAPLMVVLFLLVPRIAGPLWLLPRDEAAAASGLSDLMEPGAISRLGLSHRTAFRVDFTGQPPPPRERYWRGPVFWHFDGRRWTSGNPLPAAPIPPPPTSGRSYRYAVTLEPHQQRWVFPLEFPDTVPKELLYHRDGYLLSREPLREKRRYEFISKPWPLAKPLDVSDRKLGLQLPSLPASSIRDLVAGWRADSPDPAALVQHALRHFRQEPFIYTLRPPPIAGDPVAGFLFETRRGFCEHYAGAFVYLMRVAGVPARVVTGYQGGHWNPVGAFLDVQQADAHAWAEVWLDHQGWLRVDPTAAVAPERIEREVAIAESADADGRILFEGPVPAALIQRLTSIRGWMMEAGLLWDSLDHHWHRWVLAYDQDRQRRLLTRLGVTDWRELAGWLGAGIGGSLVLASAWMLARKRGVDPALAAYRRVANRLGRLGLVRRPSEGWQDFARRVAEIQPELEPAMRRFTELFVGIRYRGDASPEALRRLDRWSRRFPECH
jgi:transglutaminase-like putative cysteine protease